MFYYNGPANAFLYLSYNYLGMHILFLPLEGEPGVVATRLIQNNQKEKIMPTLSLFTHAQRSFVFVSFQSLICTSFFKTHQKEIMKKQKDKSKLRGFTIGE